MSSTLTRILAALLLASPMVAVDAQAQSDWAGAWGYAPADAAPVDQLPPGTYRYRATLTQRGSEVMLTFSNTEGVDTVRIAQATIALPQGATGLEINPATRRDLSFSGQPGAELLVGRAAVSDPLPFAASVGQDVIVSVTFAGPTWPARTNLGWPMDFAPGRAAFQPLKARPYLTLISVKNPQAPCTIVAFGDSITDGYLALSPVTRGWPGRLAERFQAQPANRRCGVVNMGVSGNRVLRNGRGVAALDRFWRDIASVPGVTHVVLLEGINDIGNSGANGNPVVTSETLIAGYRQFVARAHALGIKVIGATMTPALGAGYMSPEKDRVRVAVNDFIRTGGLFDGVVDFDAAVRDPAAPEKLRAPFDPGDHLHPNDAGLKAMGDAVKLELFGPRARR